MATAQEQYNQAIAQIINQMGALPRDARKSLESVYQVQDEAAKNWAKQVDAVAKSYGKSGADFKEQIMQMKAAEQSLQKEVERTTEALKREKQARLDQLRKLQDSTNTLERLKKEVETTRKSMEESRGTPEEQKYRDAMKVAKRKLDDYSNTHEKVRKETVKTERSYSRLSDQNKAYGVALESAQNGLKSTMNNFTSKAPGMLNQLVSGKVEAIAASLKSVNWGKYLSQSFDMMKDSIRAEIDAGINLSMGDYFKNGARLGLDPKETAQLSKQFRETFVTAGGLQQSFQILTDVNSAYGTVITNNAERTKFAVKQMQLFVDAGVVPTAEKMQGLRSSFDYMRKASNLTADQFNSALSSIVNDESIQSQLRATTDERQRQAIVEGTARQLAANRALGMLPEKAIAVAKAMGKIAEDPAIERIKRAAKLRAMGAAMGVDVSTLASTMISGQRVKPGTAEYQAAQAQASALSNRVSAARTGGLGREIVTETMASQLGLDQFLEQFNTIKEQTTKPNSDVLAGFGEVNANIAKTNEILERIYDGVMKNPIALAILGAVGVLANMFSIFSKLKSGLQMGARLLGFGGGGAVEGGLGAEFAAGGGSAASSATAGTAAGGGGLFSGGLGALASGGLTALAGGGLVTGGLLGAKYALKAYQTPKRNIQQSSDKIASIDEQLAKYGLKANSSEAEIQQKWGTGIGQEVPPEIRQLYQSRNSSVGVNRYNKTLASPNTPPQGYNNWSSYFKKNGDGLQTTRGEQEDRQKTDVLQDQLSTQKRQADLLEKGTTASDQTNKLLKQMNESIANQTIALSMSDEERRAYAQKLLRSGGNANSSYSVSPTSMK